MQALLSVVPLTVFAAVVIFFLKELFEFLRRCRGEARKKEALRILLSRECELNNWAIKSMREIINSMVFELAEDKLTVFEVIDSRVAGFLFRVKDQSGKLKQGSTIPVVHREVMSKNLLEIAVLDKKLFEALQPAFDAIATLEHVRQSLVYYLAPDDEHDVMHRDGFLEYGLTELEKIFVPLNNLYKKCTSNELSLHRLR